MRGALFGGEPDAAFQPKNHIPAVKLSGGSVMVWGRLGTRAAQKGTDSRASLHPTEINGGSSCSMKKEKIRISLTGTSLCIFRSHVKF